jgi:hypothetical protein
VFLPFLNSILLSFIASFLPSIPSTHTHTCTCVKPYIYIYTHTHTHTHMYTHIHAYVTHSFCYFYSSCALLVSCPYPFSTCFEFLAIQPLPPVQCLRIEGGDIGREERGGGGREREREGGGEKERWSVVRWCVIKGDRAGGRKEGE